MGISERQQREKETRQELIKNSASRLFERYGYESTTIDHIAKEAELAKGTIYLYFKSKEELFFSIVEPSLIFFLEQLKELNQIKDEPADVILMKVAERAYEFYLKEPATNHLVMRYQTKEFRNLLSQKKLERLKFLMRSNLKEVEKIIKRGVEQGLFAPTNTYFASIIFWNIYTGVIQFQEKRMDKNSSDYSEQILDQALGYFYIGLKAGI